MADLLDDLQTFLETQGVIEGRTIFIDTMDDDPSEAIGLYEYAGAVGLPQIAGGVRSIQIVVRSAKARQASLGCRAIYNKLLSDDGILNLTATRWTMPHLRQTPFKLKVDGSGRTYYAFNVGFTTYLD